MNSIYIFCYLQVDCFHVLRKSDPPFAPQAIFIKQGLSSFVRLEFLSLFPTPTHPPKKQLMCLFWDLLLFVFVFIFYHILCFLISKCFQLILFLSLEREGFCLFCLYFYSPPSPIPPLFSSRGMFHALQNDYLFSRPFDTELTTDKHVMLFRKY